MKKLLTIFLFACNAALAQYQAQTQSFRKLADLTVQVGRPYNSYWVNGGTVDGDGDGGTFFWHPTSTATNDGINIIQVTGVTTGRWIKSSTNANSFLTTGVNLTGAAKTGNFIYGIVDRYTGEKVDLVKIATTPTADSIINFHIGSDYYQRVVKTGSYNFGWWNPVNDTTTDNLEKYKAVLTAVNNLGGGEIFIPPGVYTSTSPVVNARAAFNLTGKSNITIRGQPGKSVLRLKPGTYNADLYFIFGSATTHNITIRDLVIDGGDSSVIDATGGHIHGMQLQSSDDITIENVIFRGWGGDGLYILGNSITDKAERIIVKNNRFIAYHRDGMTIQRNVTTLLIDGNYFSGGHDQDLDFEPTGTGALSDIKIVNNYFMHDTGNAAFSITLVGIQGRNARLQRSIFAHNHVLNGAVNILHVRDLIFSDNEIIDSSVNATIDVSRDVYGLSITNNHIVTKRAGIRSIGIIGVDVLWPTQINISGNNISGNGIHMESVGNDIQIIGNHLHNYDTTTGNHGYGIYLNNVIAADSALNIQVINNIINNKDSVGIYLHANPGTIGNIIVTGNTITPGSHSITYGVIVGGTAGLVLQPVLINNNNITCSNKVANQSGAGSFYYQKGNNVNALSEIVSSIAPEGVITAGLNSQCLYSGVIYIKTTATGNTGWVTYSSQFVNFPSQTGHAGDFLTTNGSAASWSSAPTGIGYTLELIGLEATPADGQSVYSGINQNSTSTTQGNNKVYIPKTGYITRVVVHFHNSGTLGSTDSGSCGIIKNGSTVTAISTAVNNSTVTQDFAGTSISIPVTGTDADGTLHDYLEFRFSHPTWSTNPTNLRYTIIVYIEASP